MTNDLIEELLNEEEGPTLDFKRDQYPFDGATDQQKGELLKDILAFANAGRRTDAYILVGIEEVKGGRSDVVGVTSHLDDAKLQQFVNSKTNRPVEFLYRAFEFEGKQIGIIEIPVQTRPVYLLKDFGGLKRREVYIRRGSSTDQAAPDEIARMSTGAPTPEPPPPIGLVFSMNRGGGDRELERFYLQVAIESKKRLLDYCVDVEFPAAFLNPHTTYGCEVRDRRTGSHYLLRATPEDFSRTLNPGNNNLMGIEFFVKRDGSQQESMSEIVRATAYYDDASVAIEHSIAELCDRNNPTVLR